MNQGEDDDGDVREQVDGDGDGEGLLTKEGREWSDIFHSFLS